MRISDWSSDVCSSDPTVARGKAAAVDRDIACGSGLGLSAEAQLCAAGHQPLGQRAGRRPRIEVALRSEEEPGAETPVEVGLQRGDSLAVDGRAVGGAAREAPQLADIARRSEEHTSELQSLMRISYAVFCL